MAAFSDGPSLSCPDCSGTCATQAAELAALLRGDDLDAAIDAGLMDFIPCPRCPESGALADACSLAAAAPQRLRAAWHARPRYRAPAGRRRSARPRQGPRGGQAVNAASRPPRRSRNMTAPEIRDFFARLKDINPKPTTELEYSSPFELLVAVILSAQATDVGVNKATRRL